ncbi:MAG: hypothetical protein ACREOI_17860 [bacterium]
MKSQQLNTTSPAISFVLFLLLLIGATLQLRCKVANTEPEPPIQQDLNSSFKGIGDLPGGRFHSEALGISDDGKVTIGRSSSARFEEEGFFRAVRDTLIVLQGAAGAPVSSEPRALTPNGEIIAGKTASARGIEAFRLTQARGMEGLGDLPGGTFHSIAFDVSADGAIVVGFGNTAQGSEAFIWDATNGMRNLKSVLVAGGLSEVERWRLIEATGISADGRIIVGNGTNPNGQNEGWIIELH